MNTDSFPTIPRRLEDNNEERGSIVKRLPYAHSVSASPLSFMLSSTEFAPSCLARPSKRKHRNSNVQRSKSSSVIEVVMSPTQATSPMKPNASFSQGSRGSSRRGSLTLSTGTSSLKRAGTSRSTSRRWSDLSQTSSVMTPTSFQAESMDDEEDSEQA